MHEEILSRLNSKNACYLALRNFFFRLHICYLKTEGKTENYGYFRFKRDLILFFHTERRIWSEGIREETAEENNTFKEEGRIRMMQGTV